MTDSRLQLTGISRRNTWLLGLAILLLTSVIALAGAGYNRWGEPEATLTLTERELGLPHRWGLQRENSGLSLALRWRIAHAEIADYYVELGPWGTPDWLDAEKLVALGFDTGNVTASPAVQRRIDKMLPREVYLVLEYAGPTYAAMRERVRQHLEAERAHAAHNPGDKQAAERLENAEKRWQAENTWASRLFAVDAGLDPAALRDRFKDRSRYLIARGTVRPRANVRSDDSVEINGIIEDLAVTRINVPHRFHDLLESLPDRDRWNDESEPRFSVSLAYGRRLEPWIIALQPLTGAKQSD